MNEFERAFPSAALHDGLLVGRVWQPGSQPGPSVVTIDDEGAHDICDLAATMSSLLEHHDLPSLLRRGANRPPLCSLRELIDNSHRARSTQPVSGPYLLAPCDLQVIKACGVTFAVSALERVVEERSRGSADRAAEVRRAISDSAGSEWARIEPGSRAAAELKERLLSLGMWSQYLEVALGPDAEIFTKASPLSAVGYGAEVGILRKSVWNNPEPEIVLAVNSGGEVVGATLGNDVNLRDYEGRSALLLGKAKDNNGACAIGPAIRIFDQAFKLDDIREAEIALEVEGMDGFRIDSRGSMRQISRDPLELVRQAVGPHHQYPDGVMLFLGTMFAPVQDREGPGLGFAHRAGDVVTISTPALGALVNQVNYCDVIPSWTFGIAQLFRNLQCRGLSSAV